MDWLRRNWPDLLIGVALLAVIAGIIVTLLGGGSVFDFARTRTPAPEPALVQPREPVTPAADEVPVSPLAGLQREREEEQEELTEAVIPVLPGDAEEAEMLTAEEAVAEELPVSPLEPEAVLEPEVEEPAEAEEPAEETVVAAANGEPWRVGVGTFRVLSNAEAEAARFRAEGHPAFISQQGDLHVVLVGPFAEEAEARDLAERFRDDGREAVVYLAPTPAAAAAAQEATSPAQPAEQVEEPAETPAQAQSPEETITATAPAAAGYLQVGAYRSEAGAEPQRQLMESLGYNVTSRTTDTGLVRLLIGPFAEDDLAAARSSLDAQGIEYYGPVE